MSTSITTTAPRCSVGGRRAHRVTCIGAGGLSIVGAILAIAVHPALAVLAAIGGLWLLLLPDARARSK